MVGVLMNFDINRREINIFKIGKKYCFKQFFDDRTLFDELSSYYNDQKYRFECGSTGERNKIMKLLYSAGYEPIIRDDFQEYLVQIDRFKKYGSVLKNAIEHTEIGSNRVFLMKDQLSVEQAIEDGAEKYTDEIDVDRLVL
mgnify:CR=1 FL=1